MFILDLATIFIWWFAIQFLSLLILPLALKAFGRFFVLGWALAKTLGILIPTYLLWFMSSLHILPFSNYSIFVLPLMVGLIIWFGIVFIKKTNVFENLASYKWTILTIEILFLSIIIAWSIIRGFRPEIIGLEKFMDFGFLNSILRSQFFPPLDMWFTGNSINYYYFGHTYSAFLTGFSSISPAIAYNLLIATIFGLAAISAFAIGKTLTGNGFFGFITLIFLTILGNIHPLTIIRTGLDNYWFAHASRINPFVINEFPIYSFIVADLHAHLLDLPIVLLIIGLVIVWFFEKKVSLLLFVITTLAIGATYITNSWDFPIYLGLFGVILLLKTYLSHQFDLKHYLRSFGIILAIILSSVLLFLPFYFQFKPLSSGVSLASERSDFSFLFLMWGFWGFVIISYLIYLFIFKYNAGLKIPLIKSVFEIKFLKVGEFKLSNVDLLILLFIALALFLIVIPEFLIVKDIYPPPYQRANTMFKLYYQAWVLLAIASGYVVFLIFKKISDRISIIGVVWVVTFCLLFIPALSYPFIAIKSFYHLPSKYQSLNGLNYFSQKYPDDLDAIVWIWKNILGQPVIVEAVGDSYSDYGRISANTGLPTIVGWPVHEWLWRGSFDEVGDRVNQVKFIYQSDDLNLTRQILKKYNVSYIYVGELERSKYPNMNETKLLELSRQVFRKNNTYILEVI